MLPFIYNLNQMNFLGFKMIPYFRLLNTISFFAHFSQMSSNQDIMCEVEISDSSIVEVVDADFNELGVNYEDYEVSVGDDQYEEVTCETEDSQGLLMQNVDDGN